MKNLLVEFNDLANDSKALTKLTKPFNRAGANVIEANADSAPKRTSGVTYREVLLSFADGQTVTLQIKQSGDIYAVKLNGKPYPIKNQDDHLKAVAEIAAAMDAGRAKFQKDQIAKAGKEGNKVPGVKSVAPKIKDTLTEQVTVIESQIAEKTAKRDELKAKLGQTLDGVARYSDVVGKADHEGKKIVRGIFTLKENGHNFEFRLAKPGSWGASHGYPYEIYVGENGRNSYGDNYRAAKIQKTVAYVVTDEDDEGKPVADKWAIKDLRFYNAEMDSVEAPDADDDAEGDDDGDGENENQQSLELDGANSSAIYTIEKSGSKSTPEYVLIDDKSNTVDMFFSSPKEAEKYADKKGLKLKTSSLDSAGIISIRGVLLSHGVLSSGAKGTYADWKAALDKSPAKDRVIAVLKRCKSDLTDGDKLDDFLEDATVLDSAVLDAAKKHNQKDYAFYVVANGKIETGWEYRDDAKEHKAENMPEKLRKGAVIVSKTGLKSLKIDPDDNGAWMTSADMDSTTEQQPEQVLDDSGVRLNEGVQVKKRVLSK